MSGPAWRMDFTPHASPVYKSYILDYMYVKAFKHLFVNMVIVDLSMDVSFFSYILTGLISPYYMYVMNSS
jgi:hypothetical protein